LIKPPHGKFRLVREDGQVTEEEKKNAEQNKTLPQN
jgi:hypothetical protein